MELLLWRWSTAVQASSDLLIAVFFVAIALTLRRAELRAWTMAWLANLAALVVTIFFWILRPENPWVVELLTAAYLFSKTLFVLMLFQGANQFRGKNAIRLPSGLIGVAILAYSVAGAILIDSIDLLGLVQTIIIALGLGFSAIYLVRAGVRHYVWLIAGLGIRSLLAVIECVAYAHVLVQGSNVEPDLLGIFVSVHSSFDTVAEWMIALGCVLTLYGTIRGELTRANQKLTAAQTQLQDLLHRDQLTGVLNRRALPTVFDEARSQGGTMLFFDLDDFKEINDHCGHQVGDQCLAHFARALTEGFGAGDRVVRFAGDEFVAVTQETDATSILDRVHALRRLLQSSPCHGVHIRFSYGHARLARDGDPEAALHEADQSMYRAKAERPERALRS
ncbi:MAG: GGDEF domain-containing protein [Rhodanobacteraceae bacterium]